MGIAARYECRQTAFLAAVSGGFMTDKTGKIIKRQLLDNGMEFVLYDRSRYLAAGRWLVDLYGEAYINIDKSFWDRKSGEDPEVLAAIKEILGENLVYAFNRKRNFVESAKRQEIVREMVQQVQSSMQQYLHRPHFPRNLFKKKYQDARRQVLLRQAMDFSENSKSPG